MSANWGHHIELSLFGESHGKGIGIVIGNLPAGLKLDMDMIKAEMKRRAPGQNKMSTPRKEADEVEIMSGVVDGITTGAPLCAMIANTSQHSKDYSYLKEKMRPGHSDYPAYVKYHGFNDVRGGGHFSGRLTAPIVFAGAIAKQILKEKGIIKKQLCGIKVLGNGELAKKLTVKANRFSSSAVTKIESAGGKAEVI